jgi:hypothetical protein
MKFFEPPRTLAMGGDGNGLSIPMGMKRVARIFTSQNLHRLAGSTLFFIPAACSVATPPPPPLLPLPLRKPTTILLKHFLNPCLIVFHCRYERAFSVAEVVSATI